MRHLLTIVHGTERIAMRHLMRIYGDGDPWAILKATISIAIRIAFAIGMDDEAFIENLRGQWNRLADQINKGGHLQRRSREVRSEEE